jgi:hypothetical protein
MFGAVRGEIDSPTTGQSYLARWCIIAVGLAALMHYFSLARERSNEWAALYVSYRVTVNHRAAEPKDSFGSTAAVWGKPGERRLSAVGTGLAR